MILRVLENGDSEQWGHVNNILRMQSPFGIPRHAPMHSYCVWEILNGALWDTHNM